MSDLLNIYCDGGARGNPGPAAAAYAVFCKGKIIHKNSKYLGEQTNNYAEHTAVALALSWLVNGKKNLKINRVNFFLDSELAVNQLVGKYRVKSENLKPIVIRSKQLEKKFSGNVTYQYIPRSKNTVADHLVNLKIDEKM